MMVNSKYKVDRLFKTRNSIPVDQLDRVKCENCGHEFQGHFCPNCGQEVAEFNRPFGFILYDFAGNFFAFDTRFFQTFKYLLFRPGFLTTEFFQGRRVRYSPPFRIFVFLSFILFILLQSLTERKLDSVPNLVVNDTSETVKLDRNLHLQANLDFGNDTTVSVNPDSLALFPVSSRDSVENSESDFDVDLAIFASGRIRDNLGKLADQFHAKLDKTTDPEKRRQYSSYIAMCRAPEMVISNVMKYMSWAFFILLPLFALVLKLFYLRRKQLYIKHLLFSIHLHSYLFFILILVTSLILIFESGTTVVNMVLLLSFPVYFVMAIKKFYGQSWGKVLLKFVGISFIYNVMLWFAVVFVFAKSVGLA